jgi:GDP-mannose transporter
MYFGNRSKYYLQAYGEVIWFGGRVTALTLLSFFFMVRGSPSACAWGISNFRQVLSSIIAAWSDVSSAISDSLPAVSDGASFASLQGMASVVHKLNVGYLWMLTNCLTSAAYVSAYITANVADF